MTTLTADEAMLAVLRQANGLAEVRDAAGNVVGFFAPVSVDRAHLYAHAAAQADTQETRRRKEAGGKVHTTQEVLDHLPLDPELLDELAAWQQVRDEAVQIVERPQE